MRSSCSRWRRAAVEFSSPLLLIDLNSCEGGVGCGAVVPDIPVMRAAGVPGTLWVISLYPGVVTGGWSC